MRFAICNELFEGWPFEDVCRFVAETGYDALELAPFALGQRPADMSLSQRRALRDAALRHGLDIVGLHWLLARTTGYHLTSPDAQVRKRTAEYLGELACLCRDVGGQVLVFGSPAQRQLPAGMSLEQGLDYATDTLRRVLPRCAEVGVYLCLEPLAPAETNFLNTCAQAVALIQRLNHPFVALHLDVKAMCSEERPPAETIRQFGHLARHFHANDANRRGPGMGSVDFVPIFQALREVGYRGYVSVEVFDFTPDPRTIARDSLRYMRACMERLGWQEPSPGGPLGSATSEEKSQP